jgi:hypothetical protein
MHFSDYAFLCTGQVRTPQANSYRNDPFTMMTDSGECACAPNMPADSAAKHVPRFRVRLSAV